MYDYFSGIKRKVGVATLLLALMFTLLWMRSFVTFDSWPIDDDTLVTSSNGEATISHTKLFLRGVPILSIKGKPIVNIGISGDRIKDLKVEEFYYSIPYSPFAIILSLFSVYCLLSRKKRG